MATATTTRDKQPKQLPPPNSDFYHYADILNTDERAILERVRTFMESKVAPIINKYWVEDAFPFELLPAVKELNLGGLGIQGYGCAGGNQLLVGLVAMEWRGSMPRSRPFSASTAAWRWVRSRSLDRRSRNKS